MSDKTQKKAKVTSAQIGQVAKTILPEHNDANAITSLADANPVASAKILERMNKINLNDTQSIVSFGSSAQLELQKNQSYDANRRSQQRLRSCRRESSQYCDNNSRFFQFQNLMSGVTVLGGIDY